MISFLTTNGEMRKCPCQKAIREGLGALNHVLRIDSPKSALSVVAEENPECGFIWNGKHGHRGIAVRAFHDGKLRLWIMERGFFKRMQYTQIDWRGFNHNASWANTLTEAAPQEGRGRFEEVWDGPIIPMKKRGGYVLIIGQTSGDSQLVDSEVRHPKELIKRVDRYLPSNIKLRFRAHPLYSWRCKPRGRLAPIVGTLEDAVAGARFVVTINSNAGNEAIAWGCPVLSWGPSLYAMAGTALRCAKDNFEVRLKKMVDGWHPPQDVVDNYLYHLACRQYSIKELESGDALKELGF